MNILAIGAHPDDIEFGCGGSLIKYATAGHSIYLLVLTDGSSGGSPAMRRREQKQAAKRLHAKEVFWGAYRDTELPLSQALIQEIEGVVKKVRADLVFVHYYDDTHQDHRHLASCTVSASRYSRNVLFYEGPTTQNFSPSVFINIDRYLEEKLVSLKAHASQVMKTNIEGLSILEIVKASAHFRGIQGRVKSAEGFVPLRLFINVAENFV
ncbi:MAG: PIG-L family deacetylase [candidate division NC10 bacterium]|nr:PIG-L family deacetylase [candidate division NC10 bacterium]